MSDVSPAHVATVREFSRFYTRRLGTLGEGLLDTPWSLTEARIVFELGQAISTDMAALRSALSLDSGYLSRMRPSSTRPASSYGRRQRKMRAGSRCR